ncbi:hypothetical protein NEOLEDRAFT_147224 [Neolentinus lepideus HHB14362 ss-1]|uniref:Uncharacterized protein n=1 Tax=Neolentinus lepideus HHB14362 ss-1 TaxID=1314782 RepID=A0A165MPH6_9AGAM|nr:hypothetical protein NEOLEDRAFT_147224 [Neolentinus lepideus HHB14362 ss-1]
MVGHATSRCTRFRLELNSRSSVVPFGTAIHLSPLARAAHRAVTTSVFSVTVGLFIWSTSQCYITHSAVLLISAAILCANGAMKRITAQTSRQYCLWLTYFMYVAGNSPVNPQTEVFISIECGGTYWMCILIVIIGDPEILGDDTIMVFYQMAGVLGAVCLPSSDGIDCVVGDISHSNPSLR